MTSDRSRAREDVGEILHEAVRRIAQIARPEAVILFGSHAEGVPRENSDIDLVVVAETEDTGQLTEALYETIAELRRGRWDSTPPFDLVVLTPEEWEYEAGLPGLLMHSVSRSGVVVHGRAA